MEVRKAQLLDVSAIIALQYECRLSPWPQSAYEEETGRIDSIFLVATSAETGPIAFITGRVLGGTKGLLAQAEIYNLGVAESCRGRGVGSLLLAEFLIQCLRFAVTIVFLELRSTNLVALKFYQRHGFKKTGERANFYSDPVENATLMELDLTARSLT